AWRGAHRGRHRRRALPPRRRGRRLRRGADAPKSHIHGCARWHIAGRAGEPAPDWSKTKPLKSSLLLHRALQRVLMLTGKARHLRYLSLSDLVSVDPTNADALLVYVQHNAGRLLRRLVEEPLEHVHDEIHRRVVVI